MIGLGACNTSIGGGTLRWNDEPPCCVGTAHDAKQIQNTHRTTGEEKKSTTSQQGGIVPSRRPEVQKQMPFWPAVAAPCRLTVIRVGVPMILQEFLRLTNLSIRNGDIDILGCIEQLACL